MTESIEIKGGGTTGELSKDITVITSEINTYKQVAGNAIFEIGRRLKHVKEEKIAERHGGWTEWLREIEMSTTQADRFMKIQKELDDGKFPTSGSIALGKLYEIATIPESERSQPHTIPSTGESKSVDEMTVRELREVKRALKEAEQAKNQAETSAQAERKERERLEEENEELSDRLADIPKAKEPEVRYEKVTEYVEVKDESIEQRLLEYEERFGDISNYDDQVTATHRQDMIVAVMSFSKGVREFIKRYEYMTKYKSVIDNLDEGSKQQYNEAVKALKEASEEFGFTNSISEIIDADYSEII